ncbi:MAG: transcriptional repressor [Anaerolineae bacterium]|nr:transcriptional repressor [Anaerolineae bacterium]
MEIAERLKQAGYKYTTPRRVVALVLETNTQAYLSANAIWERVHQQDPHIGRMSVYRTLDLFTRLGYVRPMLQPFADARNETVYGLVQDGHHHRLVCQNCNRVIQFEDCGLENLMAALEERYQCHIQGHLLEFFGLCQVCLVAASAR